MTQRIWDRVDEYFAEHLAHHDDALNHALAASDEAGLPAIQVTATQGKFLQMLARLCNARRILEVGTLGGYSTIWMARALAPDGRLITLEIDAKHAEVARANMVRARLGDRVEIRIGPALEGLAALEREKGAPFDLTFIDADKGRSDAYFAAALRMSRPGSVIVVDNVVREGAVLDGASDDENVRGIRRLIELVSREPSVSATAVQTVGSKGYDGFLIAIVIG